MNSKFFRDVMPSPENDPGVICKPFYEFPGMDSLQGFDTMSKAVFAMKCAIIDIVCKECGIDPAPYLNEASAIRFKDGYCQVSLAKAMGERWRNAPHGMGVCPSVDLRRRMDRNSPQVTVMEEFIVSVPVEHVMPVMVYPYRAWFKAPNPADFEPHHTVDADTATKPIDKAEDGKC